jgi:hypothetical protein
MKRECEDRYYLIRDGEPVEVDVGTWMRWAWATEEFVGYDRFGPIEVSTCFLGHDPLQSLHRGPPRLWQTAVYLDYGGDAVPDPPSIELVRFGATYATPLAAAVGHAATVRRVRIAVALGGRRRRRADATPPALPEFHFEVDDD